MAQIKRSDTRPEKIVRSLLHSLGYRFRIQLKGVPGRPDVAFPKRRVVIMIHGCFWHAHGCPLSNTPKTRIEFWANKFRANKERDARLQTAAEAAGWRCVTIWECETHDRKALVQRLQGELGPQRCQSFQRDTLESGR
ncbi:very short patch repair endonuclease [Mesorhizobium sp. M1227]